MSPDLFGGVSTVDDGERSDLDFYEDAMGDERWKRIDGFPDYEVSDQGRVRRITAATGATVGKVLRPGRQSNSAHLLVILRRDGRSHARRIHVLVAEAFLGPRPSGCTDVDHKDFDPANNVWTNLQFVTHAENNRRSSRAGRIRPPVKRGEESHNSKLTEESIREIRRRYADGERPGQIGADFGIRQNYVWAIVKRKAWSHVD